MRIAIPKETHPGEHRIPITPAHAKKLVQMGAEVVIESGMGLGSGHSDEDYTEVGASVSTDRNVRISKRSFCISTSAVSSNPHDGWTGYQVVHVQHI